VADWFDDPEFEHKMQIMMAMGPQNAGKAQGPGTGKTDQPNPLARPIASPQQEFNQDSQMGANESQSANFGVN